MKKIIFAFLTILITASSALAIPNLQLDIVGGTYDNGTETIVASSNVFTLIALLQDEAALSQTYYISAALTPQTGTPGAAVGSFVFGGVTVNATNDMAYGVPPFEVNLAKDSGDLSTHGIFETYFKEFSFQFAPNAKVGAYNTQDKLTSPGDLFIKTFDVDLSGLTVGYGIHFDLYSEIVKSGGDIDVNDFAPFSHDAEGTSVPEPGTLLLLGAGMFGLAVFGKRRINNRG